MVWVIKFNVRLANTNQVKDFTFVPSIQDWGYNQFLAKCVLGSCTRAVAEGQ